MLVAHDSRKQKSYCLNRPLDSPSIVTVYLVLLQTESLDDAISKALIGLAIMVYEPWTERVCSKLKQAEN